MAEQPRQVEAAHPGTERDIEAVYRTEVAELLAKIQPTFALWRERGDNALLAAAAQVLPAMMVGLAAGVGAEWDALVDGDARAVARAAQRAVQSAGTAFIQAARQMQGHAAVPVDRSSAPAAPSAAGEDEAGARQPAPTACGPPGDI